MPDRKSVRSLAASFVTALAVSASLFSATVPSSALASPDVSAPSSTAKLVFIHHSTGEAWLQDDYGNLGATLGASNYFASDTNYGWGPDSIGDTTDIGHWWTWFRGSSASTYTAALDAHTGINSSYTRSLADPGGENTIIMFKSCFPNSAVDGSPADAVPAIGSNPLAGNSGPLTVGNVKGIYLDLLEYFRTRPDRMFVLVVSPPLRSADTNASQAANARYLANWLADPDGYLSGYTVGNVFVYDYYTVLTGGHHRIAGGLVEHSAGPSNYLAFPTGDSHPSAGGDRVATSEFVPMLSAAYNSWKAGTGAILAPTMVRRACSLSKPRVGRSTVSRKKSYRWRGSVSPAQVGASKVSVGLYRKVRRSWRKYATSSAKLGNGSRTWTLRLRIKKAGRYRIRVSHSDGDHRFARSGWRYVTVK